MEGNFVKINLEDAISSKRETLLAQLQASYIREHIKKYIQLKKQQIPIKNKLKENFRLIQHKINAINALFPKEKKKRGKSLNREKLVKSEYNSPIHAKKRLTIEEELYKIKADLEMLEQKR
jgi:hypothetical protein